MPPRNAIIINLTRFGDLLQSQPIFNALSEQGFHSTLVCLENFAFTTVLMRNISQTCPFPGSGLLKNLDTSWFAAMAKLQGWISQLLAGLNITDLAHQENQPTHLPLLLINLTPTLPGRILGRLIEDRLKSRGIEVESRGFGMDQFGFGLNHNPWVAYLLASCQERGQSHFNLVDVFYRAAGLEGRADSQLAGPRPEHVQQSLAILKAEFQATRTAQDDPAKDTVTGDGSDSGAMAGFVAFQLGASSEMRRWPVEYFCEVGKILWEQARLCPVLLGTKGELPLAEEYQSQCAGRNRHPFINMCGRTSPLELAATLKNCNLLITNDTGTMHLAAGLGLDIIAIFLVTAQACDTGPYIDGACLLEPSLSCHPCAFGSQCPHEYRCRHSISPRLVGTLALDKFKQGLASGENDDGIVPFTGQCRGPSADQLNPSFRGSFRMPREFLQRNSDYQDDKGTTEKAGARVWISSRDRHNLMDLQSISGHADEERSILFKLLRHFQRQLLDRQPGQNWSLFKLNPGQSLSPHALKECQDLEALLHLVREQGGMLLSHPLPALKTRFLAGWQRAQEALTKSRYFSSIGRLWLEESQNLGDDLRQLLALSEAYQKMFAAIRQSLESQNSKTENI